MQAIPVACKDQAEWLENRRKGLGGSDIAAVAGISPFAGPIDIWQDKLGVTIPRESEPMAWGSALEQPIADRYANNHPGVELTEPGLVQHPADEWMLATPDRLVDARRGLELKTAGMHMASRWGEPPDGVIPDEYYAQVQWYMGITGLTEWDLAVLIGGQDYREFHFAFNEGYFLHLREVGSAFWQDHIIEGAVPSMDATEGAKKYLEERYPANEVETMLTASAAAEDLFYELLRARENAKTAIDERKTLENRLKALVGENTGMSFAGDGLVTWRKVDDKASVDWKGLVKELGPSIDAALIAKHTRTKKGTRRFLVREPEVTDGGS